MSKYSVVAVVALVFAVGVGTQASAAPSSCSFSAGTVSIGPSPAPLGTLTCTFTASPTRRSYNVTTAWVKDPYQNGSNAQVSLVLTKTSGGGTQTFQAGSTSYTPPAPPCPTCLVPLPPSLSSVIGKLSGSNFSITFTYSSSPATKITYPVNGLVSSIQ
jgi:hypothetical protein